MSFFDVNHLLQPGGLIAVIVVAAILFAETGMLVGFFLPGDTLLVAAGVYAAEGKIKLVLLLPVAAIAAMIGYQVGYKIGSSAGPRVFKRKDGILFRRDYMDRAEELVQKHGAGGILLARFIVVVRTLVPLVAGMGKMNKRRFLTYNIIGAILWTWTVTIAAFWVGTKVKNLDHYIIYLLIVAMVITTGTVLLGLMRSKAKRRELKNALIEEYRYFFKRI